MLTTKSRIGTAAASLAVLASGFLLSSRSSHTDAGTDAVPVAPGKVTAVYDCKGHSGRAELTASRRGGRGTVEVRLPRFRAPVPLLPGVLRTRLTLARHGGGSVTFSGSDSPAIRRGQVVRSGPLSGEVRHGDRLASTVGRPVLTASVYGHRIRCTARSPQAPGPFAF